MLYKKIIISAAIIAVFGFGFSLDKFADGPVKKDMNAKMKAQKDIDAGLFNKNTNDNTGPGPNSTASVINESFEGTIYPPPGWTKLNPDNGTGWNQQILGTTPIPGWTSGSITVPPGGGNKVAFCTWTTGGTSSNNQYLVTPQITNVQPNDSLKFYLRYWPDSFRDSFEVLISTDTPVASNFTTVVFQKNFAVNSGDTNWTQYKFSIGNLVAMGSNIYIAFREVAADNFNDGASFSLDLVSTTGVPAFANDIAAASVDVPFGNVFLPVANIAPKATFTNAGTANQTNIPVTCIITGPVNYSQNSTIASLTLQNSTQITFPATFTPTAGTYNVTVISKLGTDQNLLNDTVRSSFTIVQPNYGSGGTYFFANSTPAAAPAPSKPTYCWIDTTGSTALVRNNIAIVPLDSGNLDDGYWKLTGVTGGKAINFMGTAYTNIYVGTNGIISFVPFNPGSGNYSPPSGGLPGSTVRPAVYPAWNDLNWGNTNQPDNRLSYKLDLANNRLTISYDKAPVFQGTSSQWETFQVSFELITNPDPLQSSVIVNSNISVSHSNSSTVTPFNYLIGLQNGAGSNFLQYRFVNSSGNVISGGPVSDNIPNGGVTIMFGPDQNNLMNNCKILNLRSRFEACQNVSAVTVQLRSVSSPYNIIETTNTQGGGNISLNVMLSNPVNGVPYYVVIKSVNSIETWSSVPVTFNAGTASYNFTSSINQAFGNNQILSGGIPSIYQGDANQDGFVNSVDVILVYNDAISFITTPATDFNCDGVTDVSDLILGSNNSSAFIQKITP
jgi:hypothetical protein